MNEEEKILEKLRQRIKKCKRCRLWKDALNAVPGEGPYNSKVMIIGQNPGKEEDKAGKPFVGRSGKLLTKVLENNGIKREEVFITSVVKHVSPLNRKPFKDEIDACIPYLYVQLEIIRPKIVVLLGRVAIDSVRKEEGVKYIETYHPAAVLRFPNMRKKFDSDFKKLKKEIDQLK